ncbi:MAG TPA: hypothetical protein VFO89_13920, partial [Thermoanaerobaculia bacterium]|nr:hypothetical protein [Thermoanaerobaculia bacterium]
LARRLVRLAHEAGERLTRETWSDPTAARRALFDAAQKHAPGLASRIRRSSTPSNATPSNATGRWVRRRGTIVVLGV